MEQASTLRANRRFKNTMASLSNDTGASCDIKVSLSPDTGTLQQALIGHDNTRTEASLSNDTGATTRSLFWKATSPNLTNHIRLESLLPHLSKCCKALCVILSVLRALTELCK